MLEGLDRYQIGEHMPIKDPEARRRYQREWMRQRREEYFSDKVCIKCDSTENLELDHIDPALKIDHKIWSWAKPRREKELAKCQPLCSDCHKAKTFEEDYELRKTIQGYRDSGLTQRAIADILDTTREHVNRVLRGHKNP
ncbi:MAG: helix-turn-helix domain-containing protein [Actinobacteria bacterium]|nr:helix-turn-helix domain-containing protein [Actinomycetota bacterium]